MAKKVLLRFRAILHPGKETYAMQQNEMGSVFNMIKIVAKYRLKPGVREEYLELAKELIEESKKEAGCIQYVLHEDIKEPLILAMIEEWKDEEAIDLHMESEHMKRIIPALRALRESTEMNLYREIL